MQKIIFIMLINNETLFALLYNAHLYNIFQLCWVIRGVS